MKSTFNKTCNFSSTVFSRKYCNNETIIYSTCKIKLQHGENEARMDVKCSQMKEQHHEGDYDAKSDDFQLKFNNACNMLKIHLWHEILERTTS